MAGRGLRLVGPGEVAPGPRPERAAAACFGATVIGAAILATALGADEARRPSDARARADAIVRLALDRGSADPDVRAGLVELRRALAWRPLDTRTRVAYAAALAGLARSTQDLQAAAFHADLAARGAPVTVPVVRGAVLVLTRARDLDRALDWLRGMSGYDPAAAARLLLEIEPLVPAERIGDGLAGTGDAWLAWIRELRRAGRHAESVASLAAARARWPDHIGLLTAAAESAYNAGDPATLGRLLPADRDLPDDPSAAFLLVYRAMARARDGNASAARADLARGLDLAPDNDWLRVVGGDVLVKLGDDDDALDLWSGVRYSAPADARSTRIVVLRRIARLHESRGRGGDALRSWRELLRIAPEDAEASRRVQALTGRRDGAAP